MEWSDETYTIRQLVAIDNFPIVVNVSEGYLPEDGNEAEAFSQGDLIKLDFVKSFQKVAARFLDTKVREDYEGYMHPGGDLLIPLGYRGKLKVIHKERQFKNVHELVQQFPRYVRVLKPLQVTQGSHGRKVDLPNDSVLELDREIPGEGLVCRYESKDVVLKLGQTGRFLAIPDDTKYTLMEIIERFQLPQDVQFLDLEFQPTTTEDLDLAIDNIRKYKGCMKLMRVVKQDVVVGHYKPLEDTSQSKSGQFCRRALALLPLDSKVVNEIEVKVPVYSESDDYEFLVAKNFSENVDLGEIDGSLYLEFSNIPRIHRFEKNTSEDATPPPRPPRPKLPGSGNKDGETPTRRRRRDPPPPPVSPKPKDDNDEDDPLDEYEEIMDLSKTSPHGRQFPKPTAVTKPTVHTTQTPQILDEKKKGLHYEKTGLDMSKIPSTFKSGLKTVHKELKKRFRRSSSDDLSKKQEKPQKVVSDKCVEESDDDEEELRDYDYPDVTSMKRYEQWQLTSQRSKMETPTNPPKPSGVQQKSRPVAEVSPMNKHATSNDKPFNTLSVEEVVKCFKECSLESLATRCSAERIDGAFIADIPIADMKSLFGLSELQAKKVGMIKEGWRPKRDS